MFSTGINRGEFTFITQRPSNNVKGKPEEGVDHRCYRVCPYRGSSDSCGSTRVAQTVQNEAACQRISTDKQHFIHDKNCYRAPHFIFKTVNGISTSCQNQYCRKSYGYAGRVQTIEQKFRMRFDDGGAIGQGSERLPYQDCALQVVIQHGLLTTVNQYLD